MGKAAIKATQAADYVNAGTIDFSWIQRVIFILLR